MVQGSSLTHPYFSRPSYPPLKIGGIGHLKSGYWILPIEKGDIFSECVAISCFVMWTLNIQGILTFAIGDIDLLKYRYWDIGFPGAEPYFLVVKHIIVDKAYSFLFFF